MPKRSSDPSVKIPAAVTAASANADELHKQTYHTEEPTPPADPAATNQDPPPTDPTPTNQDPPPADPTPQPAPPVDDKTWEHKYNSMKGRFDRSQDQIRSLTDQIANMQALIATMQQPTPPSAGGDAPAELRADSLITPEELETYGEEFLNVVGKRAKQQLSPEVEALRDQVKDLQSKLAGVTGSFVKDARERMHDTLDKDCPRWRELNDDQEFIAWLGLPDPFSGAIRHELLKSAYDQNDTRRVMAFFNGFLAQEAATTPAVPQPDPEPPAPEKVPLEALAAPGRAKSAATTPPAEKPVFTNAQISQFYVDKASGRYRGREQEAQAIEAQIFDAARNGRVR